LDQAEQTAVMVKSFPCRSSYFLWHKQQFNKCNICCIIITFYYHYTLFTRLLLEDARYQHTSISFWILGL